MPSGGKKSKASTIVVRPIEKGESNARKVVLGTLQELNQHVPHEEIKEHIPWAGPKPWQQLHHHQCRGCRDQRSTRRNAGRDLGKTWSSKQSVCGPVLKPQWKTNPETRSNWGVDIDEEGGDDWETTREAENERLVEGTDEDRRGGRREVSIWDIAKPTKLRGLAKRYVVITVREIALEDDWVTDSGGIVDDEDWVTVERI